jgi:hypothetical protein
MSESINRDAKLKINLLNIKYSIKTITTFQELHNMDVFELWRNTRGYKTERINVYVRLSKLGTAQKCIRT